MSSRGMRGLGAPEPAGVWIIELIRESGIYLSEKGQAGTVQQTGFCYLITLSLENPESVTCKSKHRQEDFLCRRMRDIYDAIMH
jgi:hypothetical protein